MLTSISLLVLLVSFSKGSHQTEHEPHHNGPPSYRYTHSSHGMVLLPISPYITHPSHSDERVYMMQRKHFVKHEKNDSSLPQLMYPPFTDRHVYKSTTPSGQYTDMSDDNYRSSPHGMVENLGIARCTMNNACYNYMLTTTVDGPFNPTQDASAFRAHHRKAGFDLQGIIREGKNAAQFFKEKYGVDFTNLPYTTYAAPDITRADGIKFTFEVVNEDARWQLAMASIREEVQFFNVPVHVAAWVIEFSKDYVSTGSYNGTIPSGATGIYGSFIIKTCPDMWQHLCQSILSDEVFGKVFIRVRSRSFMLASEQGPFVVKDCIVEHEKWGTGYLTGNFLFNADGSVTGREVMTWPEKCPGSSQCFSGSN